MGGLQGVPRGLRRSGRHLAPSKREDRERPAAFWVCEWIREGCHGFLLLQRFLDNSAGRPLTGAVFPPPRRPS